MRTITRTLFETKLTVQKIIGIIGIGIPVSLIISFICYALFLRFITLSFSDILDQRWGLLLIFLVIELTSLISSLLFSFLIMEKTALKQIRNASIISIGITLPLLVVISILGIAIYNINIFHNISWDQIVIIWPSVEIYFSGLLLNHVLTIIVLNIVLYYLFFIIFLRYFTE